MADKINETIQQAVVPTSLEGIHRSAAEMNMEDLYVLWYRTGMNPRPLTMNFYFHNPSGDFRNIVERSKRFCENTGYKFTKVEKFLSNLEALERKAAS